MDADGHSPRARLRVAVVDAAGRPVAGRALGRWLAGVAPRTARGSVTVAIVSDGRVRALNRQYRGIDRATDVLSFPAQPPTPVAPPRRASAPTLRSRRRISATPLTHLGDIIIARGVARRQASDAGHHEATEWRVLALHGLLHLLGHDHEADDGAMRRLEARLRRAGGLPAGLIERGARQ
jgi:probable rRNA maturation factor